MNNFIKEIETKYNVASINVKDIQVWPFLRSRYYNQYGAYLYNIKNRQLSIFQKISRSKNVFYGVKNLFKKYDYIIFSDKAEKRVINNVYIDKIAGNLIKELGENNTLLIEEPQNNIHINIKKICHKNIISHDLIHFFGEQYYLLNKKLLIYNENILKEINEKYKLNIDYKNEILRFLNYAKYYKIFFNVYKPRALFVSEYYSLPRQSAIFMANKMGISTIELQHGIINEKNFAYNIFCKLNADFFPNFLFTFGDYVKNYFNANEYFIKKENIFAIGNGYIEYINNIYEGNKNLINIIKKFKKTVAITSQKTIEGKLIDFIRSIAIINSNILYIFIPRDFNKDYSKLCFLKNVIVFKELNFYQIVKYVDFHATVYSTCALEAPALGTPNILINIDNLAKSYYLNLLKNKNVTRFINNEKEFINLILNWHTKTREEIISLHKDFYKPNHQDNLKNALKIIFNISKYN